MPSDAATRRASSTASIEQQPRSRTISRSRGHIASVMPTARMPRAATLAATTLESTPPDIATATTASRGSASSGSSGPSAGASGDGGDDRDLVALADGRVQSLAESDVGVIDVDVDELAQLARLVVQAVTESGVAALEARQSFRHGGAVDADLGAAIGQAPERAGNSNHDCHRRPSIRAPLHQGAAASSTTSGLRAVRALAPLTRSSYTSCDHDSMLR